MHLKLGWHWDKGLMATVTWLIFYDIRAAHNKDRHILYGSSIVSWGASAVGSDVRVRSGVATDITNGRISAVKVGQVRIIWTSWVVYFGHRVIAAIVWTVILSCSFFKLLFVIDVHLLKILRNLWVTTGRLFLFLKISFFFKLYKFW